MAHSDEEDIEMIGMDDLEGGPPSARKLLLPQQRNSEEQDDDDGEGQEAESALLGSGARTRGQERMLPGKAKILEGSWPQAKGIVSEVMPTLLFMTVGLLFTGELLDKVSGWTAMQQVHQLIIIIPVVMNLKGNLEMTLSARLGTAANVGDLDDPPTRRSMIVGNLSLLQVQATVISFVAACIALLIGLALPKFVPAPQAPAIPGSSPNSTAIARTLSLVVENTLVTRRPIPLRPDYSKFTFQTFVIVSSTAMTAASLASIVLGSFMCFLIVLCRRFNLDPDNIAPPIASFLGDLVTLCLLSLTSSVLVSVITTPIPLLVSIGIFALAGACLVSTLRNPHVRPLLTQGWSPLFGAMVISSATGVVLDQFVSRFRGFALLAVVISGLPGAVGCILASRLSTALHAAALSLAPHHPLPSSYTLSKTKRTPSIKLVIITLTLITLPIEVMFVGTCWALGWLKLPIVFLGFSVMFFCVAVMISLYTARILTDFLWSRNYDPDTYALPIHSAGMDLVGQMLLAVCYELILTLFGNID